MRENPDQNNSEYGHLLRKGRYDRNELKYKNFVNQTYAKKSMQGKDLITLPNSMLCCITLN